MIEAQVDPVSFVFLFQSQSDLYSGSDQGHSQREIHMLHAEVGALQKSLRISYKDAAHRLFMTEIERVKKANSAAKGFSALRKCIGKIVAEEICPPISAIDKGEFDNYILREGKWEKKPGVQERGQSGRRGT